MLILSEASPLTSKPSWPLQLKLRAPGIIAYRLNGIHWNFFPHPGVLGETKYHHAVERILGANSVEDLIHLMSITIGGDEDFLQARPTYSFQDEMLAIAIDFNKHYGTVDMVDISHWAIFCVRLIQNCLHKPSTFFHESYPDLRYGSTICDFLEEQGLHQISKFFQSKPEHLKVPDLKHWPPIGSAPVFNSSYSSGIELEFYMPVLQAQDRTDPHPQDDRIFSRSGQLERLVLISEVDSSKGPLTLLWSEHLEHKSWENKIVSNGIIPINDIDPQYQTWTIGTDESLDTVPGLEIYIPVDKAIDRSTLDFLKKLRTAADLNKLKELIMPARGLKSCLNLYKCKTLDGSFGDECKGTVEFRYLEGTLDPELILRWSQLMASLFQVDDLAAPKAWYNFVSAVLQCRRHGKMDTNVLRVFLVFLGKGDDSRGLEAS
ncbi:hypothetical protein FBEOM_2627 [Fusarium beomiforme]|uniref:Uncharacterized protein n=1 Tax=Fusarium beomiforme TaxID=44412 RepID=A0A9P5E324_9HYPO|nr:hypothetical protein FBEOM_2627 [Fusarium beomiforme]